MENYIQLTLMLETPLKNSKLQKLTFEQVLEIRASEQKQMVLAKRYQVSIATINRIKKGKCYTNYH
jgi:hypothetical protein